MASRSRTVKKRNGKSPGGRRRGLRAIGSFRPIVLFLIAAASLGCAYLAYRFVATRQTSERRLFESYLDRGTEGFIKRIDQGLSNAFLALGIPVENVLFRSVGTKEDADEEWTFSDMEVHVPTKVTDEALKSAIGQALSREVPSATLRWTLPVKSKTVLSLAVNGRTTHHVAFLFRGDRAPRVVRREIKPRVALIIDDLGYDEEMADKFLRLDGILSFSILPHSPHQERLAAAIHKSGRDVLLHLPMEPFEYPDVDPGRGALLFKMSPDEILDQLKKDLDAVPFVVGVNNHMGSRLTEDSATMRQIFTILKKRGLFFVDSYTNPKSRCADAARLLGLKFGRRRVFLDHVEDLDAIRFQIKRLLSIAKTDGKAIGIAHPHPATLEVLRNELPSIQEQVELVPVSKLLS